MNINQGQNYSWSLFESLKKVCADNTKKLQEEKTSGKYQCGSCEKFFDELTPENECPHCHSGNWVKGAIDDPEPTENESKVTEAEKEKAKPDVPQTQKPGEGKDLPATDVSMEDHEGDKEKKDKKDKKGENETGSKTMDKVDDKKLVNPPATPAKECTGECSDDCDCDKCKDKDKKLMKAVGDLYNLKKPGVTIGNLHKRIGLGTKESIYLCNGCCKTFKSNESKCPNCKTGAKVERITGKVNEGIDPYTGEDPGTYRVTFDDGSTKELDANGKMDSVKKARTGNEGKTVVSSIKIKGLDGAYILPDNESKKTNEQDDKAATRKIAARGLVDKAQADRIATEKKGQVVPDDEDETKFMVITKESRVNEARSMADLKKRIVAIFEEAYDIRAIVDQLAVVCKERADAGEEYLGGKLEKAAQLLSALNQKLAESKVNEDAAEPMNKIRALVDNTSFNRVLECMYLIAKEAAVDPKRFGSSAKGWKEVEAGLKDILIKGEYIVELESRYVMKDGKTLGDYSDQNIGIFELDQAAEICKQHTDAVISPDASGKWVVIVNPKTKIGESSKTNEGVVDGKRASCFATGYGEDESWAIDNLLIKLEKVVKHIKEESYVDIKVDDVKVNVDDAGNVGIAESKKTNEGVPVEDSPFPVVELKDLTIDVLRKARDDKSALIVHNPGGKLFQHKGDHDSGVPADGLLIDMQSLNVMVTVYDALKPELQAKFNDVLKNEMKLARFIDKMWDWVK